MKTLQKPRFLSLVLALVLSFSFCPSALADLDPSDYSDVSEDHWAYDSMMYCSEWNIVKGFEDGTFRPEEKVSSAQFIAMLTRTFYADEVASVTDAAGQPWYYPFAKAAENKQITEGLGSIDDTPMSRYDMAAVLNNIIDEEHVILLVATMQNLLYRSGKVAEPLPMDWSYQWMKAAKQTIRDWDNIPEQYGKAVSMCYALGALTSMSDGTFSSDQTMTRAQACVVITRMKDLTEGKLPSAASQQPAQPETPQQTGSGLLANGQDATVESVLAILEKIKEKYPTGTSWGDPDIVGETNYYADGDKVSDARSLIGTWADTTYACGGWATMVSNRIFGMTGAPTREVTDVTKARPGDIVIEFGSDGRASHISIFLRYEPAHTAYGINIKPAIHTCDGNSNGEVYWDKCDGSCSGKILHGGLSDFGTRIRIFTRYPD